MEIKLYQLAFFIINMSVFIKNLILMRELEDVKVKGLCFTAMMCGLIGMIIFILLFLMKQS